MPSGTRGRARTRPSSRVFAPVEKAMAAGHLETALRTLRDIERDNMLPQERAWELHERMGQLLYWLADLPAALPHLRLAWELPRENHSDRLAALSNYLMYLHYVDGVTDAMMHDAHAAYAQMLGTLPQFSHASHHRDKLRIGYLSPNMTDHIVLNFAVQLFSAYDRARFSVHLYDVGGQHSEVTDWVAGMADGYEDLSKCRPQEAAARIHADGIDILFDLAGHSAGGKTLMIAAYKPAPIQLSGIGYFNTTGLSAMDYFLGDPFCDPPGEEANFTEQILRLPQTHLCFTPSERFRPYEHLQRTPHENVVFASFNNFAKITDAMLTAWGEILRAVPTARLLLKNVHPLKETLMRMKKRAVQAGIDPARLELRPGSKDYLADYLDADVILDTFPYQGGGTTCEALCMGLPVVVREGTRHGARFGVSLLHNAGLSELIAGSTEEYIERAVLLARDRELLSALQMAVPRMMRASPLMDAAGYVRAMEAAYQMIWERYLHEKT